MNLGQFIRGDTPTTHVRQARHADHGRHDLHRSARCRLFRRAPPRRRASPSASALLVILMMVGVGFIGFVDDFMKVSRHNSLGLAGPFKILGTVIVAIVFAILALTHEDSNGVTPASTAVSFVRDLPFDFVVIFGGSIGVILFVAWIAFITTSVSNARQPHRRPRRAGGGRLDLRDRLVHHHRVLAEPAELPRQGARGERVQVLHGLQPFDLATIAAAIVGSLIGFLWWNTSPAQVMHGRHRSVRPRRRPRGAGDPVPHRTAAGADRRPVRHRSPDRSSCSAATSSSPRANASGG